jgi:hypothetical protein
MKHRLLIGLASLLLVAAPALAAGKSSASSTSSKTPTAMTQSSKTHLKTYKIRGTVESISADQLSLKTKKGEEDSFVLQPSTSRVGDVKVGSQVMVWYNSQKGVKDATRIAVSTKSSTSHGQTMGNNSSSHGQMMGNNSTSHGQMMGNNSTPSEPMMGNTR